MVNKAEQFKRTECSERGVPGFKQVEGLPAESHGSKSIRHRATAVTETECCGESEEDQPMDFRSRAGD
jgi:hypothetical protein